MSEILEKEEVIEDSKESPKTFGSLLGNALDNSTATEQAKESSQNPEESQIEEQEPEVKEYQEVKKIQEEEPIINEETSSEDEEGFDLEKHTSSQNTHQDVTEPSGDTSMEKMRGRLQEQGQARKIAEEELAAKTEENISLTKEIEELRLENDKLSASNQKVENHPDFQEKSKAVSLAIASELDRGGVYNLVPSDSQTYTDFAQEALRINTLPFGEREKNRQEMRLMIAKRLKLIDQEETDFSVDPEAESKAKAIFSAFESTGAPLLEELMDLQRSLEEKGAEKSLEIGRADREAKAEPLRKKFAELVNMDDELIQDDPHSLISQSSLTLKEDPSLAKNLQRTIEEYRFGPRELSQTELDSLVKAGKDPSEHRKAMLRKTNKNNDFIDRVLMSVLPKWAEIEEREKSASKSRENKRKKKETESTMRKLTTPSKPKAEAPKLPNPKDERKGFGGIFSNALSRE